MVTKGAHQDRQPVHDPITVSLRDGRYQPHELCRPRTGKVRRECHARGGEAEAEDAAVARVARAPQMPLPLELCHQPAHATLLEPQTGGKVPLRERRAARQFHEGVGLRDGHRRATGRAIRPVQAEGAHEADHEVLELLRVG